MSKVLRDTVQHGESHSSQRIINTLSSYLIRGTLHCLFSWATWTQNPRANSDLNHVRLVSCSHQQANGIPKWHPSPKEKDLFRLPASCTRDGNMAKTPPEHHSLHRPRWDTGQTGVFVPSPRHTLSLRWLKQHPAPTRQTPAGYRTFPIAITTISNIQCTQTIGHFPQRQHPHLRTSPYKVTIKCRKLRAIESLYSNTKDSCIEVYWYILIKRCFCSKSQSKSLPCQPKQAACNISLG